MFTLKSKHWIQHIKTYSWSWRGDAIRNRTFMVRKRSWGLQYPHKKLDIVVWYYNSKHWKKGWEKDCPQEANGQSAHSSYKEHGPEWRWAEMVWKRVNGCPTALALAWTQMRTHIGTLKYVQNTHTHTLIKTLSCTYPDVTCMYIHKCS